MKTIKSEHAELMAITTFFIVFFGMPFVVSPMLETLAITATDTVMNVFYAYFAHRDRLFRSIVTAI